MSPPTKRSRIKSDHSSDNKGDSNGDNKSDSNGDNKSGSNVDNRSDSSIDNRSDSNSDNRSGSTSGNKGDISSEIRSYSKSESGDTVESDRRSVISEDRRTMTSESVHPDEDKFFKFALTVVDKAGRLVRAAFEQPTSQVETKMSNTDLVTETDKAVEKLLMDELSKEFPDHKFIGEESVARGAKIEYTDAPTWIIDPIDGTTNFVHRIPVIAICVGLSIKKQLRAGIVYNPITRDLYSAQVGRGAFRNGFPIHVSSTKEINRCLIAQSHSIHNMVKFGEKWLDITMDNHRRQCLAGVRGHRSMGSAAMHMIYVALGKVDAYVEYGVHAWDMAAAGVIVKEAGGIISDPTGDPFNVMSRRVLCAATPELATALRETLTHVEYDKEA